MSIKFSTLSFLASNDTARSLFEIIAHRRFIRLDELIKTSNVQANDAQRALGQLEDQKLISSMSADDTKLTDFDTYYVTADGLEVKRKVVA
jgi:hypothetical protein